MNIITSFSYFIHIVIITSSLPAIIIDNLIQVACEL